MTDRLPNGRFRNDAPRPPSGTPAGGSGYGGGKRGAGTPFAPGNRPDPERRLEGKIKAGVARALAAGHVPAAVEVWREVMMDKAAPPAARVAAAEKMVDRAEGKPEQPVEHSGEIGRPVVREEPITEDEWINQHGAAGTA